MPVQLLSQGERKGQKPHQCFHCYRMIPKGEQHNFTTCKYDSVYTLRTHKDCDAAALELMKQNSFPHLDWDEGFPPLWDQMIDGEFELDCDWLRGRFPHVVARMEFTAQKHAIRDGEWWMPQ